MDDYIQITFTISPDVREILFHNPALLSIEDCFLKYHFNKDAKITGGPKFVDAMASSLKVLSYLLHHESRKFEFEISEGGIAGIDLGNNVTMTLTVKGNKINEPQILPVKITDEKIIYTETDLLQGKVKRN